MKKTRINFKVGLIVALAAALVGVVILFVGGALYSSPTGTLMYIGYALLLLAIVIKRATWRCPECGMPFPMNSIRLPKKCISCGADFAHILKTDKPGKQ